MKTILVVDDERVIAEILAAVFQDEGYHVVIADNGREGLACLAEERPDLVLCDVMMPIIDGRNMARIMSHHPDYQSIPIIMMSAATHPSGKQDYSYEAFIRKPFDLDQLLVTVERVLKAA